MIDNKELRDAIDYILPKIEEMKNGFPRYEDDATRHLEQLVKAAERALDGGKYTPERHHAYLFMPDIVGTGLEYTPLMKWYVENYKTIRDALSPPPEQGDGG